jgi:sortase system peptidoglycan-associated protein
MMKKMVLACTLVTAIGAQPALGAALDGQDVPSRPPVLWGMGIGGALGALAGGPLGLMVGGILGAHAGWASGVESELDATRLALGDSRHALAEAEERAAREPVLLAYRQPARTGAEAPDIAAVLASTVRLTVQFRTDSAGIEPHYKGQLQALARLLSDQPSLQVRLAGHADPRGADAYNQQLSERRVEAVRQALVAVGVDAARIKVTAYGDRQPISAPGDRDAYAFDRRVILTLELKEPAESGLQDPLLGAAPLPVTYL